MEFIRTALTQFAIWLVATGLALTLFVWQFQYGERYETKVNPQAPIENIERVWFAPEGFLLTMARSGSVLNIAQFIPDQNTGKNEPNSQHAVPFPAGYNDSLYAVAPNGAGVAFVSRSGILLQPIGEDASAKPLRHEFDRKSEPVAILWMEAELIAVLKADSTLELLDATTLERRASKALAIDHPDLLISNGTFLAVASRRTSQARVLDMRMIPEIVLVENVTFKHPPLSIALSPAGRLAVGSESGPLLGDSLVAALGPVRGLQFFDDRRLLAFGAFKGLMLVSETKPPMELPSAPPGSQMMAANENHVAFAGPTGVTLVTEHLAPPVTETGMMIIYVWCIATGCLGAYYLIRGLFQFASASRERNRRKNLDRLVGPDSAA
jgi:hypothetical protein